MGAEVPRAIRQQRWSPFNVPLMWGTASHDVSTPVLDWVEEEAGSVTELVDFHGGSAVASTAAREGWRSLRGVFRAWGIWGRERLYESLGRRFLKDSTRQPHLGQSTSSTKRARSTPESHCSKQCMCWSLQRGRELRVFAPSRIEPAPQMATARPTHESWEQLDHVDLRAAFMMRVQVLKTCPRFLQGRLRFSFGVALRQRDRAKLAGDQTAECRAWKLFGLVPTMLLHRPKHSGSVG